MFFGLTQFVMRISLIISGIIGTQVVTNAPSRNIAINTINTVVNGDELTQCKKRKIRYPYRKRSQHDADSMFLNSDEKL